MCLALYTGKVPALLALIRCETGVRGQRTVIKSRQTTRPVVLALVAAFCVGAATACAGEVITAAQMVCCLEGHHECEMAMEGASCCSGASQTSHQFVRAPKAKFHVVVVAVAAAEWPARLMALPAAVRPARVGGAPGEPPPGTFVASYLLHSSFLI